jgi:hypothetical protein
MWNRPRVTVAFSPRKGVPGEKLEATISLRTRAECRTQGIDVVLEGVERVPYMVGLQQSELVFRHVALRAALPARTLPPGLSRESVRFSLPRRAPGSYSGTSRIAYALRVHVKVPWALDCREKFPVMVAHAPLERGPTESRAFSPGGTGGTGLSIECALADTAFAPGGSVRGTIALVNVGRREPKRVHVDLVAVEGPSEASKPHLIWDSVAPTREVLRYAYPLAARRFADGESLEFRARIPRSAPPSFDGRFVALRWYLQVVVELRGRRDPKLTIPVVMLPRATRKPDGASPEPVLEPVGRTRRARVWSAVAKRFELEGDADPEELTISVGTVSMAVRIERSGDRNYFTAQLGWPDLGLDFSVEARKRRWYEAFGPDEVELGAKAAPERLRVRGREAAQIRALLSDPTLIEALASFEQVELNDEGGVVRTPGDGSEFEPFATFVASALSVARGFDRAIRERLLPPREMAELVGAWRSFAKHSGAELQIARMRLHGGMLQGRRFEIATRFRTEAATVSVDDTLLRVALERPIGSFQKGRFPEPVRALADAIRERCVDLRVGPEHVEATLGGALPDPSAVEPLLDSMARLSLAIGGRLLRSAYR